MGYKIQKVKLKLKKLPFYVSWGDFIIIDGMGYDFVNRCVAENINEIENLRPKPLDGEDVNKLIPLSLFGKRIADNIEAFRYIAPNLSPETFLQFRDENAILDYIIAPHITRIPPCIIYRDNSIYKGFFFVFDSKEDLIPLFKDLFQRIDDVLKISEIVDPFSCRYPERDIPIPFEELVCQAEKLYDEESVKLMRDVHEKVERMRKHGIEQWMLEKLIEPQLELSRLIVTKDMRIMLPEFGNMEIKMEPLVKTVYILFLLHPNGINFKDLPDYEDEAMMIYDIIMCCSKDKRKRKFILEYSYVKLRKSIQDVTNPCSNSINEKCARIRSAFLSHFSEGLARNYFITGNRGMPKKIVLDRKMVVWDCFSEFCTEDDFGLKLWNLMVKSGLA